MTELSTNDVRKFDELCTERLRLRDFAMDDIPVFAAYRADADIARYQSWDKGYSLDQAHEFFNKQELSEFGQPDSWYQVAIAEKSSDKLIGDCAIHFLADPDLFPLPSLSTAYKQIEIGFTLAGAYQGQGYAKEAVSALICYAFDKLNVHRVSAHVDVLNLPSCKLLESLGFRKEATHLESEWFKGSWCSIHTYALLRREYIASSSS